MAGEDDDKDDKTEEATPRRRQEAREKGQVALSQELITTASLAASATAVVLGGGALATHLGLLLTGSLQGLSAGRALDLDARGSAALMASSASAIALPLGLVIAPLLLVVMLAGYAQAGLQVTPKAIAWDAARLNPVKGLKRLFSTRTVVRTAAALVKIVVIISVAGATAWNEVPRVASLAGADLGPVLSGVGYVLLRCCAASLVAIAVVATFDFLYQRWQHERDLLMSRKDLKEEHKTTEGDPHVKGRIRQLQREMARRRMMSDVPKATVVVTNPTHYAVALRYERDAGEGTARSAPRVVAKGVDEVAERIKQVAREHGVPLYEDVRLARALHAQVEIGEEVPESLWQSVAAVLAWVYRLKGETVGA